jgi:hypothetical protein
MIIEALLSIAKNIWDVAFDLKGQKREKIEHGAAFLNEISQILTDAADSLSKKEVPHGKCRELRAHAEDFKNVMKGFIRDEKLSDISRELLDAWEIERAFYELEKLKFDENADKEIISLRKAAGYFRAVSAKMLLDS